MAIVKKSLVAAAAVGICMGVLADAPAGAQAPDFLVQNQADELYLSAGGNALMTRELGAGNAWTLKTLPGAAPGVYQIQLDGSNDCIKAESNAVVQLVTCTANPGKPQRWKADPTAGGWTTIESRMYPGNLLTGTAPLIDHDGPVELSPAQAQAENDPQKWAFTATG